MTFTATAVVALIASPGDTAPERAAIQLAIGRWNVDRGEREGVVVVPWLYEHHAVPVLGGYAQSVINAQAVDRADVVVAFFDSRLGTETPSAASGTAEEIQRAHESGRPVHVYFSTEPVPRDRVDAEQLAALESFKTTLGNNGLLGSYNSPDHLASQIASAIDLDVNTKNWSIGVRTTQAQGAQLSARHDHRKEQSGVGNGGRLQYRTLSNDLVITNTGDAVAEQVSVTVDPLDGQIKFDAPKPFDLPGSSEVGFNLMALRGSQNVRVRLQWCESGNDREVTQVIRLT